MSLPSPRAHISPSPLNIDDNPLPPAYDGEFTSSSFAEEPPSWWNACKAFRLGTGTICALSSVAGAVAANLYAGNPIVTSSTAIASGVLAQLALETTPKNFLHTVSRFNLKWSSATYLSITQLYLQCSQLNTGKVGSICSGISKESLIFLRFISSTWPIASLANRVSRTQDQDIISSSTLLAEEEDPFGNSSAENSPRLNNRNIEMVEPNSATSFWTFKIIKAGGGTALIVLTHFCPQLNFLGMLDDAGALLIGDAVMTIAIREIWKKKVELEKVLREQQDRTMGTVRPPLALRCIRWGGDIAETFWGNVGGALFGINVPSPALNVCYGIIGGGLGATKYIHQQKFLTLNAGHLRRYVRTYVHSPSFLEKIQTGVKLSLAAGMYGYLLYGMTQSPVDGMIALLAFGGSAGGSWLATKMVDEQFFKHPHNPLLASLEFYLVKSPEYIGIPFFIINQQINIGNFALQTDPATLRIISCVAWGSLGAAVGQIPAREESPLIQAEPQMVPVVSQFLATKDIVESLQGQA